jgi:ABC-type Zn uptake system ZnuABC Zn-binding protein ZnuA
MVARRDAPVGRLARRPGRSGRWVAGAGRRWGVALAAGLAVMVLVAGCSGSGREAGDDPGGELRVVASTTQLADFAAAIGGDRVRVTSLLKPGIDAHDYEPSPADLDAVARAGLVLRNGVGLEPWLDDIVESAGFDGPVVDASQGVRLRRVGGEADPHIWQDPRNAQVMAANVQRGLAQVQPAGAAAFETNLAAYAGQLRALDAEVERQIDSLASRKVVTNHDAFGYYLDRYGLELVGTVIPSFDSSAELSGRDIRDLVARIRATGARAVFSEATLPPEAARTIAAEAGVAVVAGEDALYGDALGPPGSGADTYITMVRHNTATIVGALSGS